MKQYVPREFIMVYAPRNREELEAVARIIEAAGFWVSGERLELKLIDQVPGTPAAVAVAEETAPIIAIQ